MSQQQTTLAGDNIEALRTRYKTLVEDRLPERAEQHWPIHLDHCFGRVLLDNTLGCKWDEAICHKPAYQNFSAEQLRHAIQLGRMMIDGGAPVVEALNHNSLRWRDEI